MSFYVLAAIYSVAVQPDAEQTVAEDLGGDEGTFGLIVAGLHDRLRGPRGGGVLLPRLLLRALRSRFWIARSPPLIDELLFGLIHFDVSDGALLLLPPLALLGFIFCLVYERTGSLSP